MPDLNFYQSSQPVTVVDDTTGYQIKPNLDGSVNVVSAGVDLTVAEQSFLSSHESTVSTSETDIILLNNPSGVTKNIFFDSIVLTAVTAGRTFWVRGYEGPTVTSNGTVLASHSVIKKSPEIASDLDLYYNPTISARGDRNFVITSGQFQLSAPLDFKPLIVLYPNMYFLLTIISSGNNSAYGLDLRWRELPQ